MARKPNTSSITIRDVARQAGVSVATVSRYINETARVSEPVGERIEEVLNRLQYRPHAAARQLATQKMLAIGLLLNSIYNDFFGPLLYGIEELVQQNGYNLLVATSRPERRKENYPALGPHNVDGLLVFADSLTDKELAGLHAQKLPMVLIHRSSPEGLDIPCVTVENKAATFHLIEHLIKQHGRKSIVFMRGKVDQEDSYWREIGYREALEANGLEFDPELMLPGDFQRDVAYLSMRDFLSRPKRRQIDAVFTGDDSAAIGVMEALEQSGLRVPQDVSVVGFNDSRHSAFLNPPLTTINAPTHEVGRIATKNLFNQITNHPVDSVTLLPTEIIIRQSCGCTS
ncbi:MAG: LacI family DNA-binding transcriptional regulator [Anaerolineales bacterium]